MNLTTAVARFARQQMADGCSAHTRAAYRRDLAALGRWLRPSAQREGRGGNPDLWRITPDALARFLVSDAVLLTPSGSPRKPITVNCTRSVRRGGRGTRRCSGPWQGPSNQTVL
jgi:hypothetical protein